MIIIKTGRMAPAQIDTSAMERCAHLDTQVERLAAEELGVDRARKFWHAVEPFRGGPTREPVEAAVGPGDVAVSACCDVDDDLSFPCHVGIDRAVERTRNRATLNTKLSDVLYCDLKAISGSIRAARRAGTTHATTATATTTTGTVPYVSPSIGDTP